MLQQYQFGHNSKSEELIVESKLHRISHIYLKIGSINLGVNLWLTLQSYIIIIKKKNNEKN